MSEPDAPLTAGADPRRAMPRGAARRLDCIDAALAALAGEERRLERLGFRRPLARCREQRRYWAFLRVLFSMTDASPGRHPHGGVHSWPSARIP